MTTRPHTLMLGWGNPGRGDDGLGPQFIRLISDLDLPGVVTETGYQLQIEDAAEIARYPRVLFVDADHRRGAPFRLDRLWPADGALGFSTHSVPPAAVLALARDLFAAEPEAWILGITGYEFDVFAERLSEGAQRNLQEAVQTVAAAVQSGDWCAAAAPGVWSHSPSDREDGPCQITNP